MTRPLDDGFSRFEFRPGINQFPKWRGTNFDADPATIPPNYVRVAENLNIVNGVFESRGGQSKLGTTEISGANHAITGIHDDGNEQGYGNVMVWGPNDEGGSAQPQQVVHAFSRELGTTSYAINQQFEEFSDVPIGASNYNEYAYYGVQGGFLYPDNSFIGGASHDVNRGRNCFFFDSAGQLHSIAYIDKTKSGGFYTGLRSRLNVIFLREGRLVVRPLVEFNIRIADVAVHTERVQADTRDQIVDVIYMLSANKSPGELYSFDRLRGLRTITTSLDNDFRMLQFFNDTLYIMGGTASGTQAFGSIDTSTGTFTSITMPAAQFAGNNFYFANAIVYRSKLMLLVTTAAGGTPPFTSYVVSYDGAATAVSRTAPGTVSHGIDAGYHGATLAPDGKLYVTLTHQESSVQKLRIEIYDGSTWTSSTVLWQNGSPATGPMVTANSAYNLTSSVQGASLAYDGAGFIIVPTVTSVTIPTADQSLFWTKGYTFSTLYMDKYDKNPPQWGMVVQP